MKRLLAALLICLALVLMAGFIVWARKAEFASYLLSRQLKTPTSIQALHITRDHATLIRFWIGNPPGSKTQTAFASDQVEIDTTLSQLMGNPLIIDQIEINNIFFGLELYDKSGNDTNWNRMLSSSTPQGPTDRKWLIRRLVLTNLSVEVVQPNGQIKRYPTIARMEFNNISSESGFPVEEIEKAIFNMVLKDILRQIDLPSLIRQFAPQVPQGIPFFSPY
jgi:hypothetical protein